MLMVGYVNYRSYNLRICMVLGYIISGISYKGDMSKVGHIIRAPLKLAHPYHSQWPNVDIDMLNTDEYLVFVLCQWPLSVKINLDISKILENVHIFWVVFDIYLGLIQQSRFNLILIKYSWKWFISTRCCLMLLDVYLTVVLLSSLYHLTVKSTVKQQVYN